MNTVVRLTLCATLLAHSACAAVDINAPSLSIPDGAVDVVWSDAGAAELFHGSSGGFNEPTRELIDDDVSWHAAWAKLHANASSAPAAPAVDFTRYSVIVAALGQRGTGGYDIRVTRLATAASYLYVEITSTSPGATCYTTQALTQPVDIVRVAKPHAPLVYVERALVHDC